ncbi:GAF domain-containing protein [Halobaculum sp. D14]|uniref:GAF domain-containing protein n=1 Tax=Halobaculum sp. D14 TaxID=3421642 RepID=UPI003EBE99EA
MILCVDPDSAARREAGARLRDAGFDVRAAGSLTEARAALGGDGDVDAGADATADTNPEADVDCLVTEYELPDGTGLDLIAEARSAAADAACVLFTSTPLDDVDTAAFSDVVAEYLPKDDPDALDDLVDLVEHSLAFRAQTAYPLPETEEARLEALDRYAADPAALSASLGRLTELATALFGVNAAAVGLVDEREQRFLSCHGVSFDPLDREDTVCTYAILEDDVTVIEDVADDPRFDGNEGLAAADIRFYASASLVTPSGQPIGTFCVYHDDPRAFSERDRELLELLADEAMEQLELRRRLDEFVGETDD